MCCHLSNPKAQHPFASIVSCQLLHTHLHLLRFKYVRTQPLISFNHRCNSCSLLYITTHAHDLQSKQGVHFCHDLQSKHSYALLSLLVFNCTLSCSLNQTYCLTNCYLLYHHLNLPLHCYLFSLYDGIQTTAPQLQTQLLYQETYTRISNSRLL